MTIQRITLFKIPREEDLPGMIDKYKSMQQRAVKDGKPYILAVQAGAIIPDSRAQGHTLAVRTVFASLEDMKFYDTECEAHKALKIFAAPRRVGDVLTAYFEDAVGSTTD
ncbi:stress responsive A/B barrel domain-containing protein [Xylogone sp. PMI_703]|nr:stress responsive A/B barrel domain-containing protein [Xylogone sp. PMI_703]